MGLVVVATGVYGKASKFIPAWQGSANFEGTIMHASDMTEASMCQGKVVVVGFGKSAFDCVQVAAKQENSSATLLFREAHWCVPRNIGPCTFRVCNIQSIRRCLFASQVAECNSL